METKIYESMINKTMVQILGGEVGSEMMTFVSSDGDEFTFYHCQDCCETVEINDICGDLEDLLNCPILKAEETSNHDDPDGKYDSCTWTFYNFATVRGSVNIRWLGRSNGYYSEGVYYLEKLKE